MKVEFLILNCDGHDLRYKKFQRQRAGKIFKRIPCVHYKKVGVKVMCAMLRDKLKGNTSIVGKNSGRRMVEVAISLSHYKMWQEFLKTSSDYCVIAEDDADIHKDFVKCVYEALDQLKGSFDLLYLWHGLWHVDERMDDPGWDYRDCHYKFRHFKNLSLSCSQSKTPVYKLLGEHVGGTVAYIISRSYAEYLSQRFFPVYWPVDDFMGSMDVRRRGKAHNHLALEMRMGKWVQHHGFETQQKTSVLVDTDLEESTQVMEAPTIDQDCSKVKTSKSSKAGLAFVKSLTT
jgi:GR25 family glycosyltransferase involved in LPS biosynthesis